MISKWDPDTYDAILWLRKNKDKFRMEVFEPPLMCLTLKDRRYTNAVEACFTGNQIKVWHSMTIVLNPLIRYQTFVTQCQEDCDTLNHHINDENALKRKARITTWFRAYQENLVVPPPMTSEEVWQFHFFHFLTSPDLFFCFADGESSL